MAPACAGSDQHVHGSPPSFGSSKRLEIGDLARAASSWSQTFQRQPLLAPGPLTAVGEDTGAVRLLPLGYHVQPRIEVPDCLVAEIEHVGVENGEVLVPALRLPWLVPRDDPSPLALSSCSTRRPGLHTAASRWQHHSRRVDVGVARAQERVDHDPVSDQ